MLGRHRIAIGLGSNLGDRLGNISEAAQILKADVLENAVLSTVIETKPWGILDQPHFLNAVLVGDSEWKPAALVNYLKILERDLGRKSREKNGPREIDLDLLAVGDMVYEGEGVVVPHPGIANRDFVLIPFAEVWSDWVHPILHKTVSELLSQCPH